MSKYFKGLAHISMFTDNIREVIDFYTQNLDFELVFEKSAMIDLGMSKFAFLKQDTLIVEFLEPENKEPVKMGVEGTINHFSIEVKHLEEIIAKLKAQNVEFVSEPFEMPDFMGGIKGIFIKGPVGEKIELFEFTGQKPF